MEGSPPVPAGRCNLVMKGGMTSGVIYPPAVARIAEGFGLVGVAGTSAGAIAACAAAAAEYRRRTTGSFAGFEALQEVSAELGRRGRILELLRPDHATRREVALLAGALRSLRGGLLARIGLAFRLIWPALTFRPRVARVAANGFGLCSGMGLDAKERVDTTRPSTLTPWLTDTFDAIAGNVGPDPLTFGDLRCAPRLPGIRADEPSIDLRIMATNMTFGRPMQAPFDGTRQYSFRPDEWRRLFPARVMEYLERRGRERLEESQGKGGALALGEGWLPLPQGDALPVVVAARMSLAFPFLFSAVPLWAVDFEDTERLGEDRRPLADGGSLKRVWFSDGGITTNLPVHTFDDPLPRWPTLAINLQYTGPDERAGRSTAALHGERVYMIPRRSDGANDLWYAFDSKRNAAARLAGFGRAIFRSAQVWYDNGFLKLAGFRDSVAEVWLTPDEGGMNLDMPPATIAALQAQGAEVGERLRARFADPDSQASLSWRGHRWVRFRSAMAGLGDYVRGLTLAALSIEPGGEASDLVGGPTAPERERHDERDWDAVAAALLDNPSKAGPELRGAERDEAVAALAQLLRFGARLEDEHPFRKGPRPHVQLRAGAPLDR